MRIESRTTKDMAVSTLTDPQSNVCASCRHLYCQACQECSAAKQYSDFWICHRCGELNRRVQNLDLKGVPDELGED
jgi:hypothetical protein